MSQNVSSSELLIGWKAGDESAVLELHRRYCERLRNLAEQQIGNKLAARVGPEDIVQSVFRTFFRQANENLFSIDRSSALWSLLAAITVNKVRRQGERHLALKRDVNRELAIDPAPLLAKVVSREPGPEEIAVMTEELELVAAGLSDRDASILNLCLEGHSVSEIVTKVCVSRWTVRRILDRMGAKLNERLRSTGENF
jgi:RNA polymerase sigma factor (sigma-70 family)